MDNRGPSCRIHKEHSQTKYIYTLECYICGEYRSSPPSAKVRETYVRVSFPASYNHVCITTRYIYLAVSGWMWPNGILMQTGTYDFAIRLFGDSDIRKVHWLIVANCCLASKR